MKGTMLILNPNHAPISRELSAPPESEELHELVGGYIEQVPHFASIKWPVDSKERRQAVAFCNEDGKRHRLDRNSLADLFWCASLAADFEIPTCLPDYLVGTIIVLMGDDEFMEAL